MSYATGRSRATGDILSKPPPSLRLIIPSICLMESLSVLEDERKRHRRRLDALEQHLREVGRNVVSSHVPSLKAHLDRAIEEGNALSEEFEARLFQALEILGSGAELIHPSPEILRASRANVLIEDPTDNMILACILDHSKNHPSESKVFLSENRKDFDANVRARLALRGAGIRYFADAAKCLEWHGTQSES
ncbi:PIN domain-containing protein [Tundrisphaera lichenicola]|uniref:PIN domain-containing protein n=1 Tax=Tundrisphaera lichenicola TaxID=2029860 RepID=UPI003EBB26F1